MWHRASTAIQDDIEDRQPLSVRTNYIVRTKLGVEADAPGGGADRPEGFVFFMQREDQVWIGFTISPKKRAAAFKRAFPGSNLILVAPATPRTVALIHFGLVVHRLDGDWFEDSAALRRLVAALQAFPILQTNTKL